MTLRNNPEPEMLGPGGEEIPEMLKQEEAPASALQPANKEQKEEREEAEKQEQEQEQEQLEDIEKEFDQEQDTPENEGAVMPPEQPEQPKTFTDRMIKTAERLGESLAKMMEKLNDWASSLGLSALNGLKTVAAALGWTTAANFLEKFVRPAEVRQLIADNIPESSKVVRDASDADAIRKLEQAYADEVKANTPKPKTEKKEGEEQPEPATPAQRSFMEFCEERVNKLPKEESRSYKIADLLRPDDREPEPEPEVEKPTQPESSPEKLKKAAHLYSLAKALNEVGCELKWWKIVKGKTQWTAIDTDDLSAEKLKTENGIDYMQKVEWAVGNIFRQPSITRSKLGMDWNKKTKMLTANDGLNWLWNQNLLENFDPFANPEAAIQSLMRLHVDETGKLPDGTMTNLVLANSLKRLQNSIQKNLQEYGY